MIGALSGEAQAITTHQADVSTASSGCILLGVDGTFTTDGKDKVLAKINKIRKEACDKGVPDPRNPSAKLKSGDYVPIKWSADLERIAQLRAAEGSVCESHDRPNGESCFTAYDSQYITSDAENLAWNWSGMLDAIDQWYSEKSDWVNRNSSAVTGHYTSLIDPSHTFVALGAFEPLSGGWTCVAGEFLSGSYDGISESAVGVTGKYRQVIEVLKKDVKGLVINGSGTLKGITTKGYSAAVSVSLDSVYGGKAIVELASLGTYTWKSSNTSVVDVNASGKASSKACGTVTISASSDDLGLSASKKVKVQPATPVLSKVSAKKKAAVAKWKKSSLAKGYQIRYSTKKSMKGAKTINVKGAFKQSKKVKRLKSKTKYYVQVRAYAKVGGKLYTSSWSKKKAVKTK